MKNPWKTVKENKIYENKYGYTLWDNDVITPAGKPGKFMVLESLGFVTIVALTPAKKVLMVDQWRYALGCKTLEIPAGKIDIGEKSPLSVAKRELREECGAVSQKWRLLKTYYVGNGAMCIKGHLFLALDVDILSAPEQEDTETITLKQIPYKKLFTMIKSHRITDERTILGLLFADKYFKKYL